MKKSTKYLIRFVRLFLHGSCQVAKNTFKLSTMVGENFEFYSSRVDKMHLNCPPWLKTFFEISLSQMAKNAFILFTMVGENFGIYFSYICSKCA